MLNLIIFGAPGSGKGTQSDALIERYGFDHISTGDLLRAEMKAQTSLGEKAKSFINAGQLVPDEVVIGMIENYLNENKPKRGIIFDGFPRTIPQADALSELLAKHNTNISGVLDLQVDEEELIERLLNRGKASGRSDDNLETIQNRLSVYHTQTSPLAEYYAKKKLHYPIKGLGSVEEITERIAKVVDSL